MTSVVVPLLEPVSEDAAVAAAAIPFARSLAERTGATVTLVCILSPQTTLGGAGMGVGSRRDRQLGDIHADLERIAAASFSRRPEVVVRSGNTVDEILAVTRHLPDPVIVLASRGRSGLGRLLRGSTAFRLVQAAPCPVLVVRGPGPESTPSLARALVPLDGTPFAEQALEGATAVLGAAPPLHLHLVHVVDPCAYLGLPPGEDRMWGEREGRRYLGEVANRLASLGHVVTTEVRYGAPTAELVRSADEHDVDLIIMATHGRSTMGWFFLGSVAETLLREARLPLLLVRPDEASVATTGGMASPWRREEPRGQPALWGRPVGEIMSPVPFVAREDTPLEEVAKGMLAHRVGAVPVVGERGRLAGIVSLSDLTGQDPLLSPSGYQVAQCFDPWTDESAVEQVRASGRTTTVAQVMSEGVVAANEDEPVSDIVRQMLRRDLNTVLVVRDGAPVGMVSRVDLLKLLVPDSEIPPPA